MNITDRKKLLVLLGIAISLIILCIFIWWIKSSKTMIVPLGETIVLDSKEEEEAKKKWLPSNCLMFEGKMKLTILDSKLYDNPKEAGILEDYLIFKQEKGMSFLLITYKVNNVDAKSDWLEGFLSSDFRLLPYHEVDWSVKNIKNIDIFNPEITYSSVFKENVEKDDKILQQPKEAYYYKLDKGDSKEIQIGFYVEKEAYENAQIVLELPTGHAGKPKTVMEIVDKKKR